jgi:hypothetical protein
MALYDSQGCSFLPQDLPYARKRDLLQGTSTSSDI